jgi:hypothetical protein
VITCYWILLWRSWSRHCAATLKVSLEFFIDIILPAALRPWGSTQPLREMSTRNIFWGGKDGPWVGLTTLSPSCVDCHEIWEPQYDGTLSGSPGLYRDCFTLPLIPHSQSFSSYLIRALINTDFMPCLYSMLSTFLFLLLLLIPRQLCSNILSFYLFLFPNQRERLCVIKF